MTEDENRHLSADSFAGYLNAGIPIEHPIPGEPRLLLFIDPQRIRIGLRGPAGPREVPITVDLQHVNVRAVHHQGRRMIEIEVSDAGLFAEAYPVLCAVADRVQLDRQPMTTALTGTLRRLGHLLRRQDTLTRDAEVGLIGELCLLTGLLRVLGPGAALDSWRGGDAEEHDFGLDTHDVEVKTTTSETRTHWISSLQQLEPTNQRPLWLVSCQITTAGVGGRTLPDIIDRVMGILAAGAEQEQFTTHLYASGWRDHHSETCRQRWRLRSNPAAFAVTDTFPRLSTRLLQHAGVNLAHIADVRYRLDLTGLTSHPAPAPLDAAITAAQQELT
ncbi:PD-(D/E)XK motif protein [Plantactinospora sp. WMMB334]|uniref:PD-(D/E)XK motif protein n=1 Tax=Plantactinospora sp. WMMB334 TaxID=3404119 RepID=UPI003B95169A